MGVGHVAKQGRHGPGMQQKLQTVEEPGAQARQGAATGQQRQHLRGGRQTAGQQQGAQGDGAPVNQQPLRQRSALPHPPDAIERAIDGGDQGQYGESQHRQAHRSQSTGLAGELGQIAQHLAGNVLRHQAFDQPGLQRALQLGKHRKGGEDGQHDGEKRHQRD